MTNASEFTLAELVVCAAAEAWRGGGEVDGADVVDVVGAPHIQYAQRVVGEAGEVGHGLEAVDVVRLDVSDVEIEHIVGLVLGLVGLDSITAIPRLTFDRMELVDGLGLVPIIMGLFGVAEVLLNTEQVIKRDIIDAKITPLLPRKADWKASAGPVSRGTVPGFFLGNLPGGGAAVAHDGRVNTSLISVTAPFRASAWPCTVTPLFTEIDDRAMMVPTNTEPVPSVAELPTCQ